MESELNGNHLALQKVDEQTGLTYRSLLGELLGLENSQRPLIEVPALRHLFEEYDSSRLASLEDACGPLAKHWLPAKYEDSCLACLKPFSGEPSVIRVFVAAFGEFVLSENSRMEILKANPSTFEIEDPKPYVEWIHAFHDTIKSLPENCISNLSQWLDLFIADASAESWGISAIGKFEEILARLRSLDQRTHDPNLFSLILGFSDDELWYWLDVGRVATAGTSVFSVLNPYWHIKRYKLRNLLRANGNDSTDLGMARFVIAAKLEDDVRPLRDASIKLTSMLKGAVAEGASIANLTAIVEGNIEILKHCASLFKLVELCPRRADARCAARKGLISEFDSLIARFENAIIRCNARYHSREKLKEMSAWIEMSSINALLKNIDIDASNHDMLSRMQEALPTVGAYQAFRLRATQLSKGALDVFRVLREKDEALVQVPTGVLEDEIRRIINREARLAWKSRLERLEPSLLFERSEIESKIASLSAAWAEMRRLNGQLLKENINGSKIRPLAEWEAITRLRGQRSRRLREFIDYGSDLGLMEIRPVWLMNPDIASRVLPLKSEMFDSVIYDEASQMPVEYALPSLFRARVVIVSGDEKQMPPTAFFSSKVENDEAGVFDGEEPDEDSTELEREAFDETWNRKEIKDCPDLLHLARAVLPANNLEIHYRSKFRELIAFSNAAFYGNGLHVPVRHPDSEVLRAQPIEFIQMNGVYIDQTNRQEAEAIPKTLARFWSEPPGQRPSIGVVTFNRKQADLITEVLEEHAEKDSAFRNAYAQERERIEKGEDISFFVKNVENVQGDERDIIIFSSTFGRNPQGTFRRTFGVLGQIGGERRLNVAVTRARHKVIMVNSMPIREVADMLSTHQPPSRPRDYLQAYFEYARMTSEGAFELGKGLLERMVVGVKPNDVAQTEELLDKFAESVADFIRSLGWVPSPIQDGGVFGLDFAIINPRTGPYGIGIECDAPRHPLLSSAKARELWRPTVLCRSIEKVHRVSSHGWYHSRDHERARLKQAIHDALV